MAKQVKARSLRELGADELKAKLAEGQEKLFKLRIAKESRQLADPVSLRHSRREIARIKTVLKEKVK